MILANTIKKASMVLKNNNIISHQLDAEIILSNIMGVTREFLITKDNLTITKKLISSVINALDKQLLKTTLDLFNI